MSSAVGRSGHACCVSMGVSSNQGTLDEEGSSREVHVSVVWGPLALWTSMPEKEANPDPNTSLSMGGHEWAVAFLLLACCVHSEQEAPSGGSPWPASSGENISPSERWWSTCEALRYHLGPLGSSAGLQTWEDVEFEGTAQCQITFRKDAGEQTWVVGGNLGGRRVHASMRACLPPPPPPLAGGG